MKTLTLLFVVTISLVLATSCVSKEVAVTETYYETEYKTEVDREENITILKPKAEWWVPHRTDRCLLYQLDATYYYGYEIDVPEDLSGQVRIMTTRPYYTFPTELDLSWYVIIVDLTGVGQLPRLYPQYGDLPKKINDLITSPEYHPYLTDFRFVLFQTLDAGVTLRPTCNPRDPIKEEALRLTCLLTTFEGFEKSQRLLAYEEYPVSTAVSREYEFNAKGVKEFAVIILATKTIIPRVELTWIEETSHQVPYQVEKQRTVMQTKRVPFWETILR